MLRPHDRDLAPLVLLNVFCLDPFGFVPVVRESTSPEPGIFSKVLENFLDRIRPARYGPLNDLPFEQEHSPLFSSLSEQVVREDRKLDIRAE